MSQEFVERLTDWSKWYHYQKDSARDFDKEMEFLKRSIDGCLELLAIAAADIKALETGTVRSTILYTPSGLTVRP